MCVQNFDCVCEDLFKIMFVRSAAVGILCILELRCEL